MHALLASVRPKLLRDPWQSLHKVLMLLLSVSPSAYHEQRALAEHMLPEASQRPALHLVGMACKLPAGATGLQGFWGVVSGSQDVQRVVPPERWDMDRVYAPEAAAGTMAVATRWAYLSHGTRLLGCMGYPAFQLCHV